MSRWMTLGSHFRRLFEVDNNLGLLLIIKYLMTLFLLSKYLKESYNVLLFK